MKLHLTFFFVLSLASCLNSFGQAISPAVTLAGDKCTVWEPSKNGLVIAEFSRCPSINRMFNLKILKRSSTAWTIKEYKIDLAAWPSSWSWISDLKISDTGELLIIHNQEITVDQHIQTIEIPQIAFLKISSGVVTFLADLPLQVADDISSSFDIRYGRTRIPSRLSSLEISENFRFAKTQAIMRSDLVIDKLFDLITGKEILTFNNTWGDSNIITLLEDNYCLISSGTWGHEVPRKIFKLGSDTPKMINIPATPIGPKLPKVDGSVAYFFGEDGLFYSLNLVHGSFSKKRLSIVNGLDQTSLTVTSSSRFIYDSQGKYAVFNPQQDTKLFEINTQIGASKYIFDVTSDFKYFYAQEFFENPRYGSSFYLLDNNLNPLLKAHVSLANRSKTRFHILNQYNDFRTVIRAGESVTMNIYQLK